MLKASGKLILSILSIDAQKIFCISKRGITKRALSYEKRHFTDPYDGLVNDGMDEIDIIRVSYPWQVGTSQLTIELCFPVRLQTLIKVLEHSPFLLGVAMIPEISL